MRGRRRRRVLARLLRRVFGAGGRSATRVALAGLAAAGCDDQVKYVPWFETMTEQPAIQTYEEQPLPPPEGAVPVGGVERYDLATADTALRNPLQPSPALLERGRVQYGRFCLPCHGETGAGNGPVVSSAASPNRLPPIATLNLLSERARALSDGYMWGMIQNGRGLMPAYDRVPREERWALVLYVRELQRLAPAE